MARLRRLSSATSGRARGPSARVEASDEPGPGGPHLTVELLSASTGEPARAPTSSTWARRRARAGRSARLAHLAARRAVAWVGWRSRRRIARRAEERAALDARFAIRTAEQAAAELGQMKGVMMKAGQMLGFVAEALPEAARDALASLQADAPPMAPSLAAGVVRRDLGADPDDLFATWDPLPVAAASIGQVHRARLHDGRIVAVKIQYPGVAETFHGDLANIGMLSSLFSRFALPGLDTSALIAELRDRMVDELDYRVEAANQRGFATHYAGHPFIRVPAVVDELSGAMVLTTEWVDGQTFATFLATAPPDARQRAAEVVYRFAQGSVHRYGAFNGDPHPGNYRFHADGTVTFVDFGLVKRWSPGEWERLAPCMDAIVLHRDPVALVAAMEQAGFLRRGHGLAPDDVFAYVSSPYVPYLTDEFTFTPQAIADALARVIDVNGPYQHVIRKLDMPPSFVVLDRVVWGVSTLLGRLGARGPWREILEEYRHGRPPATPLGELDAAWWARRGTDGRR